MTPADQGTQALPTHITSFAKFRLTVVRGPDSGKRYDAVSEECAVGTSPGNQLVVTDPLVSRHHCVVRASADGTMLLDLGSTNGTRLSELRIEAAYLANGISFEIGGTAIRFESLSETITPVLSDSDRVGSLLGVSASMRRIFAVIDKVCDDSVAVLLEGESGVGKTALAELIHERSGHPIDDLHVVDLTSVPVGRMSDVLFGTATERGALEQASGGTLLLEEIGQLPMPIQAVLLAELKEGIAARVVATSESDLRSAVNSRRFRADLYYFLSTIAVRVPPLRERREDIPPLVEHFYAELCGDEQAPTADLIERLFWRPWPGNVRELRSAVQRAILVQDPGLLPDVGAPATASFEFDSERSYRESKEKVVVEFERWYVDELIRRHGGNLSRAARAARMDRSYLRELLRRHKIESPSSSRKK